MFVKIEAGVLFSIVGGTGFERHSWRILFSPLDALQYRQHHSKMRIHFRISVTSSRDSLGIRGPYHPQPRAVLYDEVI